MHNKKASPKEVTCKLRKMLNNKSTKICSKISPSRKPAPCRNKETNLLCKSSDWLLHIATPKAE